MGWNKLTISGTHAIGRSSLLGLLLLTGCLSRTADEYCQSAWVHLQEGNFADAASDARKAVRQDPKYAKAYRLLCNALESGPTRDLDGAIAACRQALRLAPNTLGVHQGIAWAFEEKKDWRSSIPEYRLEISSQEKDAPDGKVDMRQIAYIHFRIGTDLMELGDTAGAITESVAEARANDADPRERAERAGGPTHNHMERSLKNHGLLATAIANDQDVVRSKPTDAEAHHQLGLALEADEQFEPASREYAQACKLQPADSKYCADAQWLSEKLHSRGTRESVLQQPAGSGTD
jgi:eukaryotic-like serine/threonine-protein kinase